MRLIWPRPSDIGWRIYYASVPEAAILFRRSMSSEEGNNQRLALVQPNDGQERKQRIKQLANVFIEMYLAKSSIENQVVPVLARAA